MYIVYCQLFNISTAAVCYVVISLGTKHFETKEWDVRERGFRYNDQTN